MSKLKVKDLNFNSEDLLDKFTKEYDDCLFFSESDIKAAGFHFFLIQLEKENEEDLKYLRFQLHSKSFFGLNSINLLIKK
ncbi:MAG: hypothetical protein ACTSR8_22540 [Promethearchaeota archaeon]